MIGCVIAFMTPPVKSHVVLARQLRGSVALRLRGFALVIRLTPCVAVAIPKVAVRFVRITLLPHDARVRDITIYGSVFVRVRRATIHPVLPHR